ncbi:MAG TPA: hypothetical protein VFE32_17425 [Puia sp.]|jgi:hypothetical protein|nr:hypothetical protein [Puia sp.]
MASKNPAKQYLKITDRKDKIHIVPDNRHSRKFHIEQAANVGAADKPKSVKIVKGRFIPGKVKGSQEFEEVEHLETLYENLSPVDSQNAALNSENEALKAQIEALQKQLTKKVPGAKGRTDGKGDDLQDGDGEGEGEE